jgi:alpha-2-macroglobulin-like protein
MTGILNRIGSNIPADQLFLHLDRNLYHAGDTIRFKAYIRDSQTGVFETKSISLYALLLNSDHATIDSARFRISYSTASGWLKVPEITPVGDYSILAFTSGQMNYDPGFAFKTPVRVDRIRPVQHNNDSSVSQLQTATDLRFLPEGGTFIYGVRQRLAFNAVGPGGKPLSVTGIISNQKGEKITEFKSGPHGPGVVEFTPVQGETYYAKPAEEEFGNISWPLPDAEKSGVSLRVNNAGHGLLDIILKGRETAGKEYFLTVVMNNILVFSREIKLDSLFNARIKTGEIPSGTAYVTLYDNELNPVAERLIFLNEHKKMNVQVEISPKTSKPGNETELTISTTDDKGNKVNSIVSIAIIDSLSGFHNGIPFPDIESAFLFDREFYNNLPPRIRCIGLNNIDSKSIDLLMMTYGWRKYTLKEAELISQVKRSDNYDHLKIKNPGPEKKGRSEIKLLSPEGGGVIALKLNESREAVFPFDSLDINARQIMIIPDDDASRNSNPVGIEFPENHEYSDSAKLIKTDSSYIEPEFTTLNNEMPVFNPDSAIMIEPVTIKGQRKKPAVYGDKNAQQLKYTGAYTLYSKDFPAAHTFEDILYKLSPYKIFKKEMKVILRTPLNGASGNPALFVVDNLPIYDKTYIPIAQMPVSQIASVTVLKGFEGFVRYGDLAYGGVIFITTKIGNRINGVVDPNEESIPDDELLKFIRLFRSEVEYYIPTKEEVTLIPEYQFRPTILWKDDLFIDESGRVKIKYPNNLVKGTAMIIVNGTSFSNLIGSNRLSYKVK